MLYSYRGFVTYNKITQMFGFDFTKPCDRSSILGILRFILLPLTFKLNNKRLNIPSDNVRAITYNLINRLNPLKSDLIICLFQTMFNNVNIC